MILSSTSQQFYSITSSLHLFQKLILHFIFKNSNITKFHTGGFIFSVRAFRWEVFSKKNVQKLNTIFFRNLIGKFGNHQCRKFISDDGNSTYLCIFNSNDLDMFYLVTTNESSESKGNMVRLFYFLFFIGNPSC